MSYSMQNQFGFHDQDIIKLEGLTTSHPDIQFTYTFENFFHPYVGELIQNLNKKSLAGLLDPKFHEGLNDRGQFFDNFYTALTSELVKLDSFPKKEIDVSTGGPYANYNWELLFHIPLTIAVHLSKNQRFAEAQRWFHYIFNPLNNTSDSVWKFIAFRTPESPESIDQLLMLLSKPDNECSSIELTQKRDILAGYNAIKDKPFQPHAVAKTRQVAYQYSVVMKYLDNLIAWGDHLFQQDTVESINEATQRYVLAANILGPRPQRIPDRGKVRPRCFAELKPGLDKMGNALVDLEGQFPLNLAPISANLSNGSSTGTLFGIGRTLYFCIPRNEKMLSYWDTVADRLFKIRHCMNIQGVVRQLALFDPPIDPGMLVKAAAAGIDVGSIVNGLNQPIGPVRCLTLIQKALELCGEVRSLGGALLSALEKGDAEHLALIRQKHDVQIQQMAQGVRFLQWKSAQEATQSLLTSRKTALERLHYYQRLLGLPTDQNVPDTVTLDRRELNEENFDEAFASLIGQYDKPMVTQGFPNLKLASNSSPAQQSGSVSQGKLYLNNNENADLNIHSPEARTMQTTASGLKQIAPVLGLIPQFPIHIAYWGIGGEIQFGGEQLSRAAVIGADILDLTASIENYNATNASKTGSFERRADDWLLQFNLAAHEVMQNGRQILSSLIAEQIAYHEYLNVKQQIANAQEVDQFLHDKFTNEDLHLWMQGESSRLCYEYYRFAFDTARKAEREMKQELMRPEVDAQDFVKFNYWDGGRKGLLSGEALHLDVKRMEMAYHDNNKRELELTRHVSLRQLNPLALLMLKATGSCTVTIPEWFFDRDCPGHYMRRIKSVALSIPSVVGQYASVNCTLSLLRSSLRKSPLMKDNSYDRQGSEDDRFVDYVGAMQSIVTSSGNNDSGLFETNLRDERYLQFEGAGAESTWKIDLPNPKDYPAFDYATISDVVLHIRYTARQGVEPGKVRASLNTLFGSTDLSNLALLFSLKYDFPTEWAAFVNSADAFTARIHKDFFPYFAQGNNKSINVTGLELYDGKEMIRHTTIAPGSATTSLNGTEKAFDFTSPTNEVLVRDSNAQIFLIIRYSL